MTDLRDALETAQAGLTDAIAALASLVPEPATSARVQLVTAGDPIRSQTIRLPASVWQKLRLLAAAKGTTSVGELRRSLDEYFEREWPKVRARVEAA
jgi:hypothetical protein